MTIQATELQEKSFFSTRSVDNESENPSPSFTDIIDKKSILIHPNPTEGQLKIELKNYKYGDVYEIGIFSIDGKLIMSVNATEIITELDISSYPNGIYILNIQIAGSMSSWKIIKNKDAIRIMPYCLNE